MKNIAGFYCKQPSLLPNTARKGYRITHRPQQHHLALLSLPKPSTAKPALQLGLGRAVAVGKGEKLGWDTLPWGGLFAAWGLCPVLPISFQTSLDECPRFIFHFLPMSLILISFPFSPFLFFFFSPRNFFPFD